MIGVLIVAHAPLASALASAGTHVYACAPERAAGQLAVIDVEPDAQVEPTVLRARRLIGEIDEGSGVLVLVDAFGATPGNIAARLAEPGRVAVVAGANLPMLLRALCYRDGSLADTVEKALAGGTQGVMRVAGTPVQQQGVARSPAKADDLARLHHQQ
jgi:PTS system ascorbate-specific IIA component